MTPIHTALAVALVLVCGAADRIIGWGEWGRAKPVLGTVAALARITYALKLPPGAVISFPLAFLVWRTPGWGLLGGSINPRPSKALGTFARHLLSLGFLVPAYFVGLASLIATFWCMIAFAAVATALAVWNYLNRAHANQTIETLHGLALGVALAVAFIVVK